MTTVAAKPPSKAAFVRDLLGRSDYAIIGEIVEPASKVLDLGCGDGELLQWLAENKGVEARGVEISGAAGAHLLRHGLATQLVRQQRPINEVADLLGHRSIDTTAIYVKAALPQLADVALPFPRDAS